MANKKNIQKLVDALRSGQYKQACGILHNESTGTMCCMGVAAELACKEEYNNIVCKDTVRPDDKTYIHRSYDGDIFDAPESVVNWLGVDLRVRNKYQQLNDEGISFAEIANRLELEFLK